MRIYWTRNSIPELHGLRVDEVDRLWRGARCRMRRRPMYWVWWACDLIGFVALVVWVVGMPHPLYAGAAMYGGLALFALSGYPIHNTLARPEIQKILAEERDAGDATPPM